MKPVVPPNPNAAAIDHIVEHSAHFGWVDLNDIIDPDKHQRVFDQDVAKAIAESVQMSGFLHPIAVRKVTFNIDGKVCTRIKLVAGAHRLAAAFMLKHKQILCKFIEGDDDFALMVTLGEDLFRKHVTVLGRAERWAHWCEIVERKGFFGQHDSKRRRGRPIGANTHVARQMPIGGSINARRQIIKLAKKIARIPPEVKKAVIAAEIEDNQKVLLAVASAKGAKAQLKKVAELTPPAPVEHEKALRANLGAKKTTQQVDELDQSTDTVVPPETTIEQLDKAWRQQIDKLWRYTPMSVRTQFTNKINRARCDANSDAVTLVREVFMARKYVDASVLYKIAKNRGISKTVVCNVLKSAGYKRKKKPTGPGWQYRNINPQWKEDVPLVDFVDLNAVNPNVGVRNSDDSYYEE